MRKRRGCGEVPECRQVGAAVAAARHYQGAASDFAIRSRASARMQNSVLAVIPFDPGGLPWVRRTIEVAACG